jgi:hypothetical protein
MFELGLGRVPGEPLANFGDDESRSDFDNGTVQRSFEPLHQSLQAEQSGIRDVGASEVRARQNKCDWLAPPFCSALLPEVRGHYLRR